ncbi:hypothetical protein JCM5350_000203 [Sporobolomyces pararoseus]
MRNSRQFRALVETVKSKQNAHQVRRLVLCYSKGTVPKYQVATAAKIFTSIRELSLYHMKLDDLTVLNGFQDLETLTLEYVRQAKMTFFTLPHLRHFTIGHRCELDLAWMKDENAPQLEALALRRPTKLDGWNPSLSSTTPWNLTVLNLDWYTSYQWTDSLPNVLVNIDSLDAHLLLPSGVQHARITSNSRYAEESYVSKLVLDKPVPLETLILPTRFKPLTPPTSTKSYLWRIVRGCQQRGIELFYEESPNWELDSDVSKAFIGKMKRLKLARQEDQHLEEEEEDN